MATISVMSGARPISRSGSVRVSSFLSQSGAEGVYLDDVLGNISTWSNCKCFPAKYSNLGAWQSAMVSFIRAVGPALKSRGFYVLASSHTYVEGAAGEPG